MIITIDGMSGVGKGTLSKKIHLHFNLKYLETGFLYRAISFYCIKHNINITKKVLLQKIAHKLQYKIFFNHIYKNVHRTKYCNINLSHVSSTIASFKIVRKSLLKIQRNFCIAPFIKKNGAIIEGRDIGTNIYPTTFFKFFLKSNLIIRSKRRFKELIYKKRKVIFRNILRNLIKRDFRDYSRHKFPVTIARDSIVIDSSYLNQKQTYKKFIEIMKKIYLQTLFKKTSPS
jgi:cytidylate kinase